MTMLSDKICVRKPVFVVVYAFVCALVRSLGLRSCGVLDGCEKEVHP